VQKNIETNKRRNSVALNYKKSPITVANLYIAEGKNDFVSPINLSLLMA
jgi:hypothetical protein